MFLGEVPTPLLKHLMSILTAKSSTVKALTEWMFSKVARIELRDSVEVIWLS